MARLRITDYVHRGNGITVSFSDGDVCDITYEFDAVAPDSIEQLFDFNVMGVKNNPDGNIVLTNNTSY